MRLQINKNRDFPLDNLHKTYEKQKNLSEIAQTFNNKTAHTLKSNI
jgi:hypothetical protein